MTFTTEQIIYLSAYALSVQGLPASTREFNGDTNVIDMWAACVGTTDGVSAKAKLETECEDLTTFSVRLKAAFPEEATLA